MNQHLECAWSAIDLAMLFVLARIAPTQEVAFVVRSTGIGSAVGLLAASALAARARRRWLPREWP